MSQIVCDSIIISWCFKPVRTSGRTGFSFALMKVDHLAKVPVLLQSGLISHWRNDRLSYWWVKLTVCSLFIRSVWSLFYYSVSAFRPFWVLCFQCHMRQPHKFDLWVHLIKNVISPDKCASNRDHVYKGNVCKVLDRSRFPLCDLNVIKRKCILLLVC